jgi:hypothetical protein
MSESIIDGLGHVEGSKEADFVIDQVDMSRLSKFVLGKYARSAKPEDLTQFERRSGRLPSRLFETSLDGVSERDRRDPVFDRQERH